MEILSVILFPIIFVMDAVFGILHRVTGVAGLSVILLAFVFGSVTRPLRAWAERRENRLSEKIGAIEVETNAAKRTLSGEALFMETEKIYGRHGYHPIHAIGLSLSLLVTLPFLLSAVVLFLDYPPLQGTPFLGIDDLSAPDRVLGGLNILPLAIFLFGALDGWVRFRDDPRRLRNILLLSAAILVLVYSAPSALALYWLSLNVFAFCLHVATHRRTPAAREEPE